jgi:hypothetical protein
MDYLLGHGEGTAAVPPMAVAAVVAPLIAAAMFLAVDPTTLVPAITD